jgi:ABC-type nickel/cobalt efflux system permease component RcnA
MRQGYAGRRSTSPDALITLWGVLALMVSFALFVLLLPVAIGLAIACVALVGIAWCVAWVRVKWSRAKRPNGVLDGRRNVRVRMPGEGPRSHEM